jgi:putative Holliday junction resolvase
LERILAIDFGTKRIGLAVTDTNRIIATALDTVPSAQIFDYLTNYLKKENVSQIVIGLPKHLNGSESGPIEALNNFKKAISKLFPNIAIESIDERFTSKIAVDSMLLSGAKKKDRENKSNIDKISAVIILQDYLSQLSYRKS